MKRKRKQKQRNTPYSQTAAEREKVRGWFAKLEQVRPEYVRQGRDRAKKWTEEGWGIQCPECLTHNIDTFLDVLCILPALPREVRHINIGMDGQAETTPIGQDVIVECPTCGHLKWITITHEVPDE